MNAKNAVENNYLTEKELHAYAKEIMGCERSSNKQECLRNTDNKYYRIHLNHEQQFNNACHGAMMSQACADQRGIVMDADHAWASSNIPGLPPSYNLTYSDIRDLGCQNNADCESRMRKYDQINVNSYNLRSNLLQERAAVVRGLTNTVFGQGSYERLSPDDQEMLESMLPDTFTGINGWRRPKAIRQSARNNMSNEGGTRSPASQESRRPNTASPSVAGQGKNGHTPPATPTQPNRQAQTGVPQGKPYLFDSSLPIPNQRVRLTQPQKLYDGRTLPAGSIVMLNGNAMKAVLPNGTVITGNGSKLLTPPKALPKPPAEHGDGNRQSTQERVRKNIDETGRGNQSSRFRQHAQTEREVRTGIDFDHIIGGDITRDGKRVTGGHSLNRGDVRVVEQHGQPDKNGVTRATVEIQRPDGSWQVKTFASGKRKGEPMDTHTMFPKDWDNTRIRAEVTSAWENRKRGLGSKITQYSDKLLK